MSGISPVRFDDLLLLVGKLNYSWTNTESLLIHLIAGLAATDKETAVIIFLTLNTTRARIDLVERLSKAERLDPESRDRVLALTARLARLSGLRNRYSHCLYSFDQHSGAGRTIMMRIADRKASIRMGQSSSIDAEALSEIESALSDLSSLNRDIWSEIRRLGYPV